MRLTLRLTIVSKKIHTKSSTEKVKCPIICCTREEQRVKRYLCAPKGFEDLPFQEYLYEEISYNAWINGYLYMRS